jgi:hypothetical protein
MNRMTRRVSNGISLALLTAGLAGGGLLLAGCGDPADQPTTKPAVVAEFGPTTRPDASPAGAPTYGKDSGMGFSTGDAAHSGGQGSGLMGYHGTGSVGTNGAITDSNAVKDPVDNPISPVLPPQR